MQIILLDVQGNILRFMRNLDVNLIHLKNKEKVCDTHRTKNHTRYASLFIITGILNTKTPSPPSGVQGR